MGTGRGPQGRSVGPVDEPRGPHRPPGAELVWVAKVNRRLWRAILKLNPMSRPTDQRLLRGQLSVRTEWKARVRHLSGSTIPSRAANSIQVMKMCEAMAHEGYEVTLLAPARARAPCESYGPLWDHYRVEPLFDIRWLPARGPMSTYVYGFLAALHCRLWRPPDLVFARHLPGALVAALLGCSVIFEAHSDPSAYGRLGPLLFSLLIGRRRLLRLVVVSKALEEEFVRTWPRLRRRQLVVVAPDGVDVERFEDLPAPADARRQLGLLDGARFVAGYSGHLYPGRGVEVVLELAGRLPDMQFLLIGGEPEDVESWRDRSVRAGLDNVTLTGFLPNSEVPLHLAACDALLMPYQRGLRTARGGPDTSRWMSPLKMFEYMAAGRPILASELPVLREVLDESSAILLPPHDVDAWQMGLERLRQDPDLTKRLSHQARASAGCYSWRSRIALCLGS